MQPTSTAKLIELKELAGNDPAQLNALQRLFSPHIEILETMWLALWCTILVIVLLHLFKELRKE